MTTDLRFLADPELPVLVSDDAIARGDTLRQALAPFAAYFRRQLGVTGTDSLSVLNQADWEAASLEYPYEYSLYDPDEHTLIVPATYTMTALRLFEPPTAQVEAAETATLLDHYLQIGLAHLALSKTTGVFPVRWFNRVFTLYLVVCAERAIQPAAITDWQAWVARWMAWDITGTSETVKEEFTLEAFEFLAMTTHWLTYYWFQARFMQRALTLEEEHGEALLQPLLHAFTSASAATSWSAKDSFAQTPFILEQIVPGWLAWMQTFHT